MEFFKSVASESVIVSVEGTDFSVNITPVCRKCNTTDGTIWHFREMMDTLQY